MKLRWAGLLLAGVAPAIGAEDRPAPRDAAEVVQEGDVSQWLQHYQRERGEEWARQQRAQPAGSPASTAAGEEDKREEK
jgi:hypothetical protein